MENTKITTRQRRENYDAVLGATAAPHSRPNPGPLRSNQGGLLALVPSTSTEGPHLALVPRAPRPSRARRCPAAFGFYYTFLLGSAAARPFLRECPRPPARQNFARSIAPPNFRAPRPRRSPAQGSLWRFTTALVPSAAKCAAYDNAATGSTSVASTTRAATSTPNRATILVLV